MSRYFESDAGRNQEDAVARVLESGAATGGAPNTGTAAVTYSSTVTATGSAPSTAGNYITPTLFEGTNGTAWPAPWVTAGGAATLQSGWGRLAPNAANYAYSRAHTTGLTIANVRVTGEFRINTLSEQYPVIHVRHNGAWADGIADRSIALYLDISGNAVDIQIFNAGAQVGSVGTAAPITWATNTRYRFTIEVIEGSGVTYCRAKVWSAAPWSLEPETWSINGSTTNAVRPASGGVGAVIVTGASDATSFIEFNDLLIQQLANGRTQVLAIGDSITAGPYNAPGYPSVATWRKYVFDAREVTAAPISFVGQNWSCGVADGSGNLGGYASMGTWDVDHHARNSWTVTQAGATAPADVTNYQPDIAVIYLGLNDLADTPAVISGRIGTLIDNLRAAKADLKFVLCQLAPATGSESAITTLNGLLATLRSSKTTSTSPIALADCNTGFNAGWLYDGLHFTDAGDQFVAGKILGALTAVSVPSGSAAVTYTERVTAATGRKPTSLWKGGAIVWREPTADADLALLNVSWWYDWTNYANPEIQPFAQTTPGYVPMCWGDWEKPTEWFYGASPAASQALHAADTMLGFNEPDLAAQSNMSVARALALWPQLVATGCRLGSPATTAGGLSWLTSFMAGSPKVDFICVHWYQDADGPISNLAARLDYLWTTYGKPIWITEVGNLSQGTAANEAWMDDVFGMLSTRPFVERVSWFANRYSGWPGAYLIEENGTLNVAGVTYASYPPVIDPSTPRAGSALVTYTEGVTSAVGKRTPKSQATTTTYTETVPTAVGKKSPVTAQVTTTYTESIPSAVGKCTPTSAVTTTHTWVTTGQGVRPIVGVNQGTALVTYTDTVSTAAGKKAPVGSAGTVTYTETLLAQGKKLAKSTVTTTWTETIPVATGKKAPQSLVTETYTETIIGTGKKTSKSTTVLTTNTWSSTANGFAPSVGVKQGFATVTYTENLIVTSKKVTNGAAVATNTWTSLAQGKKITKSSVVTTYTESIPAAVGKKFPRTTLTTATYTFSSLATGYRMSRGLTTFVTHTWNRTAQGVSPIVGFSQGTALVTVTWTPTPIGKKFPRGSAPTVTVNWPTSAQGKKFQQGSALVGYRELLTATGKKFPSGGVLVVYNEFLTATGKRFPKSTGLTVYRFPVTVFGIKGIAGFVEAIWNDQEVVEMMYGDKPVVEWLLVPS